MKEKEKDESSTRIPCRYCLLRDGDEKKFRESVGRILEAIPDEERAEEQVYERRLFACRTCPKLLSGMCRICGCFVEVRAAYQNGSCPMPGEDRWKCYGLQNES